MLFLNGDGSYEEGLHTARFGEIEQRGVALTPKGQTIYDTLLAKVRQQILPKADGSNAQDYMEALGVAFSSFPDTYAELRSLELAYFRYAIAEAEITPEQGRGMSLGQSIEDCLQFFNGNNISYY